MGTRRVPVRAALAALAALALVVSRCGSSANLGRAPDAAAPAPPPEAGTPAKAASDGGRGIRYVFVVAMENEDAARVYDAAGSWPYLNGVALAQGARALAFVDELPRGTPSEPHYVWMEAGTNVFADHTFTDDSPPSATNSTGSTDHLVAQLARAANGADWMSYQEGLDGQTGLCPLVGAGFYRPRHNPFVFFRDVIGTPPSQDAEVCVAHHKPLSALAGDLEAGIVERYSFITPNLCHDAHGQTDCDEANRAQGADGWLSTALPPLLAFANDHDGAVFIVWDESVSGLLPFVALGPHVRHGYDSPVRYDHGSLLKSLEEILGLPILPAVAPANDFADLFEDGYFP